MDLTQLIHVGLQSEKSFTVEAENLASHLGSGSLGVLATPWMIAFMERVSHALLAEYLPTGTTSVGMRIDVQHLAPTPLGSTVVVRTEVTAIEGRQVDFNVTAFDAQEQVGAGTHRRFVVDYERFAQRVAAKAAARQASE